MVKRSDLPQLGTQARLAKRALNARDKDQREYWSGVTWLYDSVVTNGPAGGVATVGIRAIPGEDNEFEIMSAVIQNRDTVNRASRMIIEFPTGNFLFFVLTLQNSPNAHFGYPFGGPDTGGTVSDESMGTSRQIVSGEMELMMDNIGTAASQDARFAILARVRGEKPMVTAFGNSDVTSVVNVDRFF